MSEPTSFKPYIPANAALPEFTWRAVLMGTILGMVFGASSLYLVLKVGITVSASIPVAVISLTLFRMASRLGARNASVLENNIAQTAGSAGESIAFGVGVTMPAIMILGFDLEMSRVLLVAATGAVLGILMMIPLRRAWIVEEHGKLSYPEGTACAAVIKAGASDESRVAAQQSTAGEQPTLDARPIFIGFGIGLLYKVMMSALKLWKDVPEKVFGAPFKSASVGAEISPELLGVGYIIGPRIAATMCAGGVFTYLCLIPMIHYFGGNNVLSPGTMPIADMSASAIRGAYVLYIGAGAVTAAGIISLIRALPSIVGSIRQGLGVNAAQRAGGERTDQDLSLKFVAIGVIAMLVWIMSARSLHMNLMGAVLLLVFGFLFVAVSSRLTGQIGSSSNPVSGMTIATLLLTCLVFLMLGWTGSNYFVTALSVGGIVCVAASNGGTTSQDLKTGFLLGATPRLQQYAIILGSLMSVLVLGPILLQLNQSATVYVPIAQVAPDGWRLQGELPVQRERLQGPQARGDAAEYRVWHKPDDVGAPAGKYLLDEQGQAVWLVDPGINGRFTERPDGSEVRKFDAPKATLVSYIIKGVLDQQLPWGLVLFGVMIALFIEMCGVNSLSFAVGVYLPLSTTTPILVGGLIRWWIDRRATSPSASADQGPGILLASGYIAGGAIAGIVIALMAGVFEATDRSLGDWATAHNPFFAGPWADVLALVPFAVLAGVLVLVGRAGRQPAD